MLTFNDLLALEGIGLERLRLVRHQDQRMRAGRLYEAWRTDRGAFERYQQVQKKAAFRDATMLASFAVTETGKTVFVGMYRVDGIGTCPEGTVDHLLGKDVSGDFEYALTPLDLMGDYQDQVVIDWGGSARAWVQRADNQAKRVLEIAPQHEPRFPGFRTFVRPIAEIPALPSSWQQILQSVKGVYLLVDLDSGKQYVGSAKGVESLFGRWLSYATDGNGGNKGLKRAARGGARRYQVSVLEVVDDNTQDETIEQIESYWKRKLLTKEFGLNDN
jgi:hypothetical protein